MNQLYERGILNLFSNPALIFWCCECSARRPFILSILLLLLWSPCKRICDMCVGLSTIIR